MEFLNRYIMNQHIIRALQEGCIYGKDREHPLLCHTGRHGGGVPLGNPHVKKAGWKLLGKRSQSGSVLHGCGNGADAPVPQCQAAKFGPKFSGKIMGGGVDRLPCLHTEPPHSMKAVWVAFCREIAFPLYSPDVEQNWDL